MAKERSLVRASDLNRWAYCRRAWWLSTVKGVPHRLPERLDAGNRLHQRHGQAVSRAAMLARWGRRIVIAGVAGLAAVLVWFLFSIGMG